VQSQWWRGERWEHDVELKNEISYKSIRTPTTRDRVENKQTKSRNLNCLFVLSSSPTTYKGIVPSGTYVNRLQMRSIRLAYVLWPTACRPIHLCYAQGQWSNPHWEHASCASTPSMVENLVGGYWFFVSTTSPVHIVFTHHSFAVDTSPKETNGKYLLPLTVSDPPVPFLNGTHQTHQRLPWRPSRCLLGDSPRGPVAFTMSTTPVSWSHKHRVRRPCVVPPVL